MINIYTKSDLIPKDKEFISDNASYFIKHTVEDNKVNRFIISEIDGGEYLSSSTFKDRLGITVYTRNLSMSSKTLINIANNSDYVFSCAEMGYNAFELMFQCIDNANVYVPDEMNYELPEYADLDSVTVNGERLVEVQEW
jgi:hypothetical protein